MNVNITQVENKSNKKTQNINELVHLTICKMYGIDFNIWNFFLTYEYKTWAQC